VHLLQRYSIYWSYAENKPSHTKAPTIPELTPEPMEMRKNASCCQWNTRYFI